MADIFDELEEDLKEQKIYDLWKKWGNWIIGAALLIVIGSACVPAWKYYHHRVKADESTRYASALQLVAEGKLRRSCLPLLFTKLTTAEHQRTPNPTLVAVFGLYLAGLLREEIAKRLDYSVPLVRNYINQIYARFNVTKEEWPKTTERKERLRTFAREAGFV